MRYTGIFVSALRRLPCRNSKAVSRAVKNPRSEPGVFLGLQDPLSPRRPDPSPGSAHGPGPRPLKARHHGCATGDFAATDLRPRCPTPGFPLHLPSLFRRLVISEPQKPGIEPGDSRWPAKSLIRLLTGNASPALPLAGQGRDMRRTLTFPCQPAADFQPFIAPDSPGVQAWRLASPDALWPRRRP
jgi:hypothetical protein